MGRDFEEDGLSLMQWMAPPAHRALHLHLLNKQAHDAEFLAPRDLATSFWLIQARDQNPANTKCLYLPVLFKIWCRILTDFEVSSPRWWSSAVNIILSWLMKFPVPKLSTWRSGTWGQDYADCWTQGFKDWLTLLHFYQRCKTGTITPWRKANGQLRTCFGNNSVCKVLQLQGQVLNLGGCHTSRVIAPCHNTSFLECLSTKITRICLGANLIVNIDKYYCLKMLRCSHVNQVHS